MFRKFFEKLFGKKTESQTQLVETKIEATESSQKICGCGRSRTGYCVGLHSLTQEEWNATQSLSSTKAESVKSKRKSANNKVKNDTSVTAAWPFTEPVKTKPAAIKAKRKSKITEAAVGELPIIPNVENSVKKKKSKSKYD